MKGSVAKDGKASTIVHDVLGASGHNKRHAIALFTIEEAWKENAFFQELAKIESSGDSLKYIHSAVQKFAEFTESIFIAMFWSCQFTKW